MFLDCANEPNTFKKAYKDYCSFGRKVSGLTVAREIFFNHLFFKNELFQN